METVIKLGEFLTRQDFTITGSSLENLGMAGMTLPQFQAYIATGMRTRDKSGWIDRSFEI